MKNSELVNFFSAHRNIYGVCPNTGEIFRLSDGNVFLRKKNTPCWLTKIETTHLKLDELEDNIRERARERGRITANKIIRKIDPVFTPKKLNHADAYSIFHPVDFILFKGMSEGLHREVVVMDSKKKFNNKLAKSIASTIDRGNYEWVTIRVEESGKINLE